MNNDHPKIEIERNITGLQSNNNKVKEKHLKFLIPL